MIKTDLELLEQNRNEAQSMVLALTAQINLTKAKIISLDDNQDRAGREKALGILEKELEGHKKMVRELDSMIKLEQDGNLSLHSGDGKDVRHK